MNAPSLRLAELLAGLSLAMDLATGQPPTQAMRTCLLATGLARARRLAERDVADVYYTTLLQHVGCTAFHHEAAGIFGTDDGAVIPAAVQNDLNALGEVLSAYLPALASGLRSRRALRRARTLAISVLHGTQVGEAVGRATCEVAALMARRLGLQAMVERSLHEIFERWDGTGTPHRLAGEAIALPARFAHVASSAVHFHRIGGPPAAVAVLRRRAGRMLDPSLVDTFGRHGPALLSQIEAADTLRATVAAEPDPVQVVTPLRLEGIARAFGDFVDLKTPYTHGHAAGTAALVDAAGRRLGFGETERAQLRRAALLHDLGRIAVPTSIWEKPGPLAESEWEQVRLHAYHGERILSRSAALAPLAPIVGLHHERLDGSGYHRAASAGALPIAARVLAAADTYQAMGQGRPHRAPFGPDEAAAQVSAEVVRGRLDGEAAAAVLAAAGHADRPARTAWPAGLSDRQVEVLRLVAAGLSNRDLAVHLGISPRTAEHHVQDVYVKIGVSSRAAAAMFAMEQDLLRGPARLFPAGGAQALAAATER